MHNYMKRDGVPKKKVIVCFEAVCNVSTHYDFEAIDLEIKTVLGLSVSKVPFCLA